MLLHKHTHVVSLPPFINFLVSVPVLPLTQLSPFFSKFACLYSSSSSFSNLDFFPPEKQKNPFYYKWVFSLALSVPPSLNMVFVLLHRSIHFMFMKNPHQDSRQSRLLMYSTFCGKLFFFLFCTVPTTHRQG